ncbi:MAG: hypothetical protein E7Z87_03945 [Cyanobacteria bacterium SIG26]|nr:hypothetical protein [Cyanobacteria bacterium SIG26]
MTRLNKIFGIVFGIFIFCVTSVQAAEYTKFSKKFINAFEDCQKYEETVYSDYEGKSFTTKRQIHGWRNRYCLYEETISSGQDKYQLSCRFTNVQMDELYEAMKVRSKDIIRHDLELFVEQVDPKTGEIKYVTAGTTTISGNKPFITWAKYQNNPYFCSRKKL